MQSAENLEQIKIWESMQGASYWVSVTFDKFKTQENRFFQFQFYKKNLNNLLSLQIYVLDSENEEIEFIDGERK